MATPKTIRAIPSVAAARLASNKSVPAMHCHVAIMPLAIDTNTGPPAGDFAPRRAAAQFNRSLVSFSVRYTAGGSPVAAIG